MANNLLAFVLTALMDVASPLCYVWLLCKILRLRTARRRLFPRQLVSLAIAGTLFNITIIPVLVLNLWHFPEGWRVHRSVVCREFVSLMGTFRIINALQEVHIAATFLAQAMRWTSLLPCLNAFGIPLVWLLGITLGILNHVLNFWSYNSDTDMCEYKSTDWVSASVFVTCFAFSLLSFVLTTHRSGMPDVVKRNNFKRAAAYPLISVVTMGFILSTYLDSALFYSAVFFPMACFFECSNGCLNVLCFAIQSRIASRAAAAGQTARACSEDLQGDLALGFASFHVDFGVVDIVEEITQSSVQSSLSDAPSLDAVAPFVLPEFGGATALLAAAPLREESTP